MLKKVLSCIILFTIPIKYGGAFILNKLGHQISKSAKFGFSLILTENIKLGDNTKIGHFNFLKIANLTIENQGYIGILNILMGDINVHLNVNAAIGSLNIIKRPGENVVYGNCTFKLGVLSKVTTGHKIDCIRNIIFGDYCTLAGANSQLWTHGYVHEAVGAGRFRVDGEIHIGNNVYIGSMCVINAGVKISDGITVGSNSCVSKSISIPGLYVSQPLRHISVTSEETKVRLNKIEGYELVEEVYEKKIK